MGYEVKMIVGKTHKLPWDHREGFDTLEWIQPIAELELSKCGGGPFGDLVTRSKHMKTPCYFFAEDGNTKVSSDRYGEPLCKVSARTVLKALQKETEPYRRFDIAIVLLKSIISKFRGENPIVVFYGH